MGVRLKRGGANGTGAGRRRTKRVALRDIAEKLGVSRMTVSLALRDDPRVAKTTMRRVQSLAKRLGYARDPEFAKAMSRLAVLKHSATYMGEIAFLTGWHAELAWKSSPHFAACFQGAAERSRELGYRLGNFWTRDPTHHGKRLSDVLWARGIKGVLIAAPGAEVLGEHSGIHELDWARFCCVYVGPLPEDLQLNAVRHDHFDGMLRALHELEALGYRRIGFAAVDGVDLLTSHRWTAAYMHWRSERCFDKPLPGFVYRYGHLPERDLVRWIRDNKLDAVIAMQDEPLRALRAIKRSAAKPLAFCALNRVESSPVSGINQHEHELGRVAVDLLVHGINHDQTGLSLHPVQTVIKGSWHKGDTTPPVRGKSRTTLPPSNVFSGETF
jgi:DNA-binding LacI/PurR family transcriptional regulator